MDEGFRGLECGERRWCGVLSNQQLQQVSGSGRPGSALWIWIDRGSGAGEGGRVRGVQRLCPTRQHGVLGKFHSASFFCLHSKTAVALSVQFDVCTRAEFRGLRMLQFGFSLVCPFSGYKTMFHPSGFLMSVQDLRQQICACTGSRLRVWDAPPPHRQRCRQGHAHLDRHERSA